MTQTLSAPTASRSRISLGYAPVIAVAALAVLVRLPFFAWPLTGDEGNYAYTAYWWAKGQTLYADYLGLEKPQGLYLAYWLLQGLFGLDGWAIRLWGALWSAATAVAVYFVAGRMAGPRSAGCAALLFAVFSSAPHVNGFHANAETFMALPLTLSVLALLARRPFLAGLLLSAAVLFKVSAASGLLVPLYWLVVQRRPRAEWARVAAGGILPLSLAAAHGALTVGLPTYLYNVYLFRASVGWANVPSPSAAFVLGWYKTTAVWAPLALLAGVAWKWAKLRSGDLAAVWLFASFLGVGMGGEWVAHYFLQLLPPLCVLAGCGLAALSRRQSPLVPGVALAAFVLAVVNAAPIYYAEPENGPWRTGNRLGIRIAAPVADYLQTHTSASDSIYVAYYQANIYHQARRAAAVPFLSRVQLLHVPGAYERTVQAVEDGVPAYILVLDQSVDGHKGDPRFAAALARRYAVEATFDGSPLYRRLPP